MNLRANIVSAIWTLCLVAVVNGQPQPAPTRNARSLTGFYPTGVYHFGDMETVNSQSGNVMLRIPLPGLAPGHAGLSAGINLLYNSQDLKSDANLWECSVSRGPNFQWNLLPDALKGGWRYGFDYQLTASEATTSSILGGGCSIQCPDKGATHRWQYALIFPDGSSHSLDPVPAASLTKENGYWNRNPAGPLRACKQESTPGVYSLVDVPNSTPSKLILMTNDGTYIRVEADPSPTLVSWTAYMPDGSKIITGGGLPQRLIDRNNNSIRLGSAWNPVTNTVTLGVEDDLGRSVAITTNSTTLIDQVVAKSYQNSSNLVWQIYWKDIRPNRTYKPYSSRDTFTILPNEQPMPDRRVLWKVEFPSTSLSSSNVPQDTTQNYLFDYGESATAIAGTQIYLTPGTGEIKSFTLPSGAKTEYAFTFTDSAVSQWASQNYYDRILRGKIITKKLTYIQPAPAPGGVVAPASETWTYQIAENGSSSTVTAPNGALTTEGYNQGLLQSLTRPDGSVTEKIWYQNGPGGNSPVPNVGSGVFTDLMNPHPRIALSSLPNAAGAPTTTAITQTDLDPNGNAREEIAYNLVDYSAAHSGGLALLPASATVLRKTTRTFYAPAVPSPPAGVEACTVAYYACANLGPNLRSAQTEKIETPVAVPGGVNQSMSAFCYDDAFTRGNLVHQASWDSARGTLPGALINCNLGRGGAAAGVLVSSTGYDLKGNPIWQIDPKNSTTNIEYDSVSSTQCSVNPTFTQANSIVQLPYPARIRNPLNQQVQRIYDCPTGVLRIETDANNVVLTNDYDRFGRLASSIVNGETSKLRYSDNDRYIVQIDDVDTPNDQKRFTVERFDALGRRRLLQQSENGQMPATESDGILTQFRYSPYAVGDNAFVSRPYRNADTANLATGWSVTRKDSAGRLTEVRHYSGNALPEVAVAATAGRDSWTYDGTTTIATDADSKVRHERRDALGRIDRVLEGGTLETSYAYNHLGNLTNVCQGAGCVQTREFRYTSLGQLQRAKNPEADEINYTYDVNGNLETKIQGPVATTLVYDVLNRPTLKSYNDNPVTPAVRFCYDGTHSTLGGVCQAASTAVGNAIGRLTAVSNSLSSSLMLSFDPLGRVLGSRQVTPSTAQTITADLGYTYTASGQSKELTLPSGRKVTYLYDNAGRLQAAKRGLANSTESYASGIAYQAHGGMAGLTLGNTLAETYTYNSRLQPETISLGNLWSLKNNYGTTNNNGNVRTQELTVPFSNQGIFFTYSYDALNRLSFAGESTGQAIGTPACNTTTGNWCYGYAYDSFGNRAINARFGSGTGSGPWEPTQFTAATNRIADAGWSYNARGNITAAPDSSSLVYDAENLLVGYCKNEATCVAQVAANRAVYSYDGNGRRVRKRATGEDTVFVYDAAGQLAAEYGNLSGGVGLQYLTQDHLGSTRVITDAAGAAKRFDYEPFGKGIDAAGGSWRAGDSSYGTDSLVKQRFTGKERDAETGLDYFGARYMSAAQGRFSSVDPKTPTLKHSMNPQKWNKYAYVLNNPLALIDPNGLEEITVVFRAFIPQSNVGFIGRGDNRSFSALPNASSRISVTMHIETDPTKNKGNPLIGRPDVQINTTHNNLTGNNTAAVVVQAPTVTPSQDANGNVNLKVQMNLHSGDLPAAMSIRSDVNIGVNVTGTQGSVQGTVSGSPAFETNFTPQGASTTNLPIQGASSSALPFTYNLTQTNTVNKKLPIKQVDQQ